MRLLRIGHRLFNMSALVDAEFNTVRGVNYCMLRFAAPEGCDVQFGLYRAQLEGPEVAALEHWLGDNCDYLTGDWSPLNLDTPAAPAAPEEDTNTPF